SRWPSSTPRSRSPGGARSRPSWQGYDDAHVASRRARRVRGRARARAEEGVLRGLRAVPLLRADPGRDLPLQQARPPVRAAAELPVLPAEDGGRLGLGQEPPDPDHPARGGLHLERRDRRGAAWRRRRADADARGARRANRRVARLRRRGLTPDNSAASKYSMPRRLWLSAGLLATGAVLL